MYLGWTYPSTHKVRPPDTVYLLGLLVVSSAGNILRTDPSQNTVEQAVPWIVYFAWSILLFVGASLSLTGVFLNKQPKSMLIESAGRWFLAPACFAYTIALLAYAGRPAWLVASLVFGLGVSSVVRIRHINHFIKVIEKSLHELEARQDNGDE